MKNILTAFLFLCISFTTFAQVDRTKIPEAGPAPKIEIGEYDMFTLDNGLKVIVVKNSKIPTVSYSLTLDYKPIYEGEKAGYVSMAGQILSTGTSNRAKAELDEEVDFIGASLSASSTGMFASSLTKHQEKLLELMSDVLLNPSFPENELDKIKKQTISGLAAYKDSPDQIAGSVSDAVRYGKDHPYGELMRVENVEAITLDDLKKFYGEYFRPNIAYLTVVGDITLDQVKPLVEKYFSSWEKGDVPVSSYDSPSMPEKTNVVFVDRPSSVQSIVRVTYPVDLKPGSPDAIAGSLMNTILGRGISSYLMQNLRETKGYTYDIRSSLSSDRLVGSFSVQTSVRNEVSDSSVYQIMKELNRIRDEKVDAEQLASIKNFLTGIFALQLESPQTVARYALNIERYGLPKDYYATYLEKLNAVTAEDVQAVAQKYIKPDNSYVVVVGKKDEVAESLSKFGAVSFYDIYGDPVKDFEANIEPLEVINKYLDKIGGVDKLNSIKSVQITAQASIQGMSLDIQLSKVTPDRSVDIVSMGGMEMQKVIYDRGEVKMMAQGTQRPVSDAEKMALEKNGLIFPELEFGNDDYKLEVTGLSKVGSEEAYQITVTYPAGNSEMIYYGVDSGLKLKTEKEGQGEILYKDYTEVDGILMPYTSVQNTPQGAIEAKVKDVKLNEDIPEALFK